MRRLTLYARSRQVPASLATVVIGAVLVWALTRGGDEGPGDPRLHVLVLGAGAVAASIGLSGQDLALDRTAAIRWVPRRTAHVLFAAAVTGAVPLAVPAVGGAVTGAADGGADGAVLTAEFVEFVIRDSAGLMGLAALGAALSGGHYAWTLPFGWLAFSFVAPPPTSTPAEVGAWMMLPPGTPAATWTAIALTVAGTTAYAVAGPRR
ncbi:hypothetical protein [Streptomyces zingiberis]|uniref:ABC transporter permease n=1 Tax=Streptomyces zingiberis TaxID=2053010 RepID=A0ABX1BTK5_9ACTN|nr:hypothetical protein [Streptomyces zingiberis]NJP99106.1 hypothetical protein [Streptomyces zingiberis]